MNIYIYIYIIYIYLYIYIYILYINIFIYIYIYMQVYFQKILILLGLNTIYSFVRGNALKQFVGC